MTSTENLGSSPPPAEPHFSFGKMVFYALGAGVLVLVISVPIILGLARWSPVAALVVAVIALVVMIGAIGIVSNRMVETHRREVLAIRARPRAGIHPTITPETDRNNTSDGQHS